jgi:hypothetical protein
MYRNTDTGAWSEPVISMNRLNWTVQDLLEIMDSGLLLLRELNYFVGKGVEPKLPCWLYINEPILSQLIGD